MPKKQLPTADTVISGLILTMLINQVLLLHPRLFLVCRIALDAIHRGLNKLYLNPHLLASARQ